MKPEEFVKQVREAVIESNFKWYQELFFKNQTDETTDPSFKLILNFCMSLSSEQKSILLKLIRQIEVETLASFFSILDGEHDLLNQNGEFRLTINGDKHKINEDLTNILYEIEQRQDNEIE